MAENRAANLQAARNGREERPPVGELVVVMGIPITEIAKEERASRPHLKTMA
jgi:hypothetical protein